MIRPFCQAIGSTVKQTTRSPARDCMIRTRCDLHRTTQSRRKPGFQAAAESEICIFACCFLHLCVRSIAECVICFAPSQVGAAVCVFE